MTDETKNDGGLAFPHLLATVDGNGQALRSYEVTQDNGMTLRDWFAGQALAGYFANPSTPHRNASDCAAYMYEMADAMLAERSK